jgi:hypothetical protein
MTTLETAPSSTRVASLRWLTVLLAVATLAVILAAVYLTHDYYEDNSYNVGVIKFTAADGHGLALISELTALFFQKISVVHPEDWHRGLSLLLAAKLYRLVPSDEALRTLHLGYVALFAAVLYAVTRRCVAEIDDPRNRRPALLVAITLATFTVTPIALLGMARFAVDDVPGSAFALLAATLLIWRSSPSMAAIAAAGLALGVAVWMKDLFLLWVPLAVVLLILVQRLVGRLTWARIAVQAVVLAGVATVVVVPKLVWNLYESGSLLPAASQIHNRVFNFGYERHLDPHTPFYLSSDDSYRSILGVAGSLISAVKSLIFRDTHEIGVLLLDNKFLCLVALACLLIRAASWPGLQHFHGRALLAGLVFFVPIELFVAVGGGEIQQYRYSVAPIALLYVACFPLVVLATFPGVGSARFARAFWWVPLLLLFDPDVARLLKDNPPVPPEGVALLATQPVPPGRTALLDVKRAMYLYSVQPQPLTGIIPDVFLAVPPADAARWLADSGVAYALLRADEEPLAARLRDIGFRDVATRGQEVLLAAPR